MNQEKYRILKEAHKKDRISVLWEDLSKVERMILDYVSDNWKFHDLLWQERKAISDLIFEKPVFSKMAYLDSLKYLLRELKENTILRGRKNMFESEIEEEIDLFTELYLD